MKTLTSLLQFYLITFIVIVSHNYVFAQDLIINEVMFASNGQNNEFIELYNTSNSEINLLGYKILSLYFRGNVGKQLNPQ